VVLAAGQDVLPAGTALPDGVVRIGGVEPGEGVAVVGAGPEHAQGWRHFA
jgi:hypothetical protein